MHSSTVEDLKPTEEQLTRIAIIRDAFADIAAAVKTISGLVEIEREVSGGPAAITRDADGAPRA